MNVSHKDWNSGNMFAFIPWTNLKSEVCKKQFRELCVLKQHMFIPVEPIKWVFDDKLGITFVWFLFYGPSTHFRSFFGVVSYPNQTVPRQAT